MRSPLTNNWWKHWFWISLATNISCTSLMPETNNIIRSNSFSQTEDANRFLSQSVSVSKVSVKMGRVSDSVREGRNVAGDDSEESFLSDHPLINNYLTPGDLPIVNPRVPPQLHPQLHPQLSQPQDSFLAQLLEQLTAVANVTVNDQLFPHYNDVQDDAQYQLVYKDDYLSDYDLDQLSDDYLDYLYEIYDDLSADLTYYDDVIDTIDSVNDVVEAVVKVEEVNNNLDEAFSRSEAVSGRLADDVAEEELIETGAASEAEIVNSVNKLEYVDRVAEEALEQTMEDLTVQQDPASSFSEDTDFYVKIAILTCVSIAVLFVSGGLLFVILRRKIKKVGETTLVTNEDEFNNQVVFQTQLKPSSTLQDHIFTNHFGKSAVYMYDDLHSLDNDSFLTSLETISEKDRFDFE